MNRIEVNIDKKQEAKSDGKPMKKNVSSPQYRLIAAAIAKRIAEGEFPEGTRLYGRSVMASEYRVSPETIRRAMKLLADMQVVRVQQGSGVVVISEEQARLFLQHDEQDLDIRLMRRKLQVLLQQHEQLGREITELVASIAWLGQRAYDTETVQSHKITVPETSSLIGESLEDLQFWQRTGATIIAIQRGSHTTVSPGPYAQLQGGDVLVVVGELNALAASERYIHEV